MSKVTALTDPKIRAKQIRDYTMCWEKPKFPEGFSNQSKRNPLSGKHNQDRLCPNPEERWHPDEDQRAPGITNHKYVDFSICMGGFINYPGHWRGNSSGARISNIIQDIRPKCHISTKCRSEQTQNFPHEVEGLPPAGQNFQRNMHVLEHRSKLNVLIKHIDRCRWISQAIVGKS